MQRVLVAFASREGQTERISHHIARGLEDRGFITRLINLASQDTEAGADDCDASVLAGSVHRGHYAPALGGFVMRHAPAIRCHPSAFVSVSLSAASLDPAEKAAIDEIANGFLYELGWHPEEVWHIAGAVHDRQLNMLERAALHGALRAHGQEPHASGDTELTDWDVVDRFIEGFARRVARSGPAGA